MCGDTYYVEEHLLCDASHRSTYYVTQVTLLGRCGVGYFLLVIVA